MPAARNGGSLRPSLAPYHYIDTSQLCFDDDSWGFITIMRASSKALLIAFSKQAHAAIMNHARVGRFARRKGAGLDLRGEAKRGGFGPRRLCS